MKACPKFDKCSAPICPLDPDWRKRIHLAEDRVCAWLLELSKVGGPERLRGYLADATASTILQIAPLIRNHGHHRIERAMEYASKFGSNLEKHQKMAKANLT